MKQFVNCLLMLTICLASTVSCVNDNLADGSQDKHLRPSPLCEQVSAMRATVEDLVTLQKEGADYTLAVEAIEKHISFIEAGASWEEGSLATLRLQNALAAYGCIDVGVGAWLGLDFSAYYELAVAEMETSAAMSSFLQQQMRTDALVSDVEAGIRNAEDPKALDHLASDLKRNIEDASALVTSLSEMTSEVETAYVAAITDASNLDDSELSRINTRASSLLTEADNTLNGLIARVRSCEARLNEIAERLGALENDMQNWEELLGLIQSVTFMSEYSEEKAVAYYDLDLSNRDGQNRAARIPSSTISLNYIVRPASAAKALTESSIWNNGLEVFGYYADRVHTKAVVEEDMIYFNITDVKASSESGIITISMENNLKNDFFFKQTGAKLALSVTCGKTDVTSKFVEIIPKDQSETVYVDGLELDSKSLEIDNGSTAKLTATVTPSNATTGGVVWTSEDDTKATVSSDGTITAKAVTDSVCVIATTKGIDEWGNKLTAKCKVKVNPSVRLSGPAYVEEGGKIEIRIESQDYISPDLIEWSINGIQYQYYAAVEESESGSGMVIAKNMWFDTDSTAYMPVPVTCKIAGAMPLTLTHGVRVVAKQPKGIAIEGLSYDNNKVIVKKGATHTIKASYEPAGVNSKYFRIIYMSCNTSVAKVDFSSGVVTGVSLGTAYIDVKVTDSGSYNYFYPTRNEMVRQLLFSVEPYWVESIILPSTWSLKLNEEATISAEFTSDGGEGVQPEDKTLTWTSDNPSVVSVDASTGKMTAKAVGTAVITATTSGSKSVPEGASQKSSTCTVTVKAAGAADPVVGDYYYSDGTWSTELDASKTVIGVVFSTENATGSDTKLRTDFPDCSNGLAVCITEVTSKFGGFREYGGYDNSLYPYLANNYAVPSKEVINGYSSTLGLEAYREYRGGGDYIIIGEVKNNELLPAVSSKSSRWYIPSVKEMSLIRENITAVNNSLGASNAISESGYYWTSTVILDRSQGYDDCYAYPFNMSKGDVEYKDKFNEYPVRVVLAF